MSLSFEEKLRNYARLGLLHGLGMNQTVRPLYIESYQIEDHNHFIPILAEEAYKIGVETVDVRYRYPELERAMIEGAPEAYKLYFPEWITDGALRIIKRDGARIALNGNGDLGVMDNVDPKYASKLKSAFMKANEPYTSMRMQGIVPWTILDVPTFAWAKKLDTTIEALWEFLFSITGADQENSFEFAKSTNETLHRRCGLLDKLIIKTLRFVGEGTDLLVGLTDKSRWQGGQKQARDGTWYEANWPSFEVYTTPDWRETSGAVSLTLPSVINGPIVENLRVVFQEGRVVDYEASSGIDAFEALIGTDQGACRLGEIALVGLDSPLSKFNYPHYCGLLDENKRCHMAFGEAYTSPIEGGTKMSQRELRKIGRNESAIHHDVMISDETTEVFAMKRNGNWVKLMENGRWIGIFA